MKPSIQKNIKNKSAKSKVQLKFEKLITQIETQQLFNTNLKAGLTKAGIKISTELTPIMEQNNLLLRDVLLALDRCAEEIGVGKYNREWLDAYMTDNVLNLLDIFGYQDEKLSALLEKYGNTTIQDMVKDEETQAMAASFSEAFGIEIDIEEMLKKGHQSYFDEMRAELLQKKAKKQAEDNQESNKEEHNSFGNNNKGKPGNDQDKTLLKEARNVYMRLIKEFHPDRELDESLREQKESIVKEVTAAYQNNDFLTLLQLQVKYLDDNEIEATTIAEDMIKRYTKLLQKQLAELMQQTMREHHFSGGLIEDFIDKNGNFSHQKFAARKRDLEKAVMALKSDIAASQKRPKSWFKEYMKLIKDIEQERMIEDIFGSAFNF